MRYVELNAKDEFSVENLFMDMAYQTLEFYKNREYLSITAPHHYEKFGIKIMNLEDYHE